MKNLISGKPFLQIVIGFHFSKLKKIMNRRNKIIIVLMLLILLIITFNKNLIVNIHDTYYVISHGYSYLILLVGGVLFLIDYGISIKNRK
ncbi:hypothetical protein TOREUM_20237 [Tenacibaculum litoreum]